MTLMKRMRGTEMTTSGRAHPCARCGTTLAKGDPIRRTSYALFRGNRGQGGWIASYSRDTHPDCTPLDGDEV